MTRPERTFEDLFASYLAQFERAGEIDGTIRLKWILNSAETRQTDEDEMILLATRVKNKTL